MIGDNAVDQRGDGGRLIPGWLEVTDEFEGAHEAILF